MNKAVATLLKRYPKGRWSELARKVGLSQAALSLLMNEQRYPRRATKQLFSDAEGVLPSWWDIEAKPAKARKR